MDAMQLAVQSEDGPTLHAMIEARASSLQWHPRDPRECWAYDTMISDYMDASDGCLDLDQAFDHAIAAESLDLAALVLNNRDDLGGAQGAAVFESVLYELVECRDEDGLHERSAVVAV